MATTYYPDLQKLYVAYFNRPGDAAGLAYWETVVEANKGSTAAVSAAFAASTEYKTAYAGMSNAAVVDAIYTNLFGHAADTAGNKYYADLLTANKLSINDAVTQIAGGAQGTDLVAFNSKVTAAGAFTAAVDTDAEKAGYSGDAANKVAKAYLSGITDANSLAANTTPAALNAAVAATVAAGTPFSVASALAQINTAQAAQDAYVKATVTKDADSNGVKNADDITFTKNAAVTTVSHDLTDSASASLFAASTTTQAVRDALVSAQQAVNADQLSKDQAKVAADNVAISKVDGLSNAVSAQTAANSTLTAAQTAQTAADADLAAKQAAFQVNNSATGTTVFGGGTSAAGSITVGGTVVVDIAAGANGTWGKATLHTGIDATKYVGLTDLIASYNADATAHNTTMTAQSTVNFANLGVNLLDIAPDANGTFTVAGHTGAMTEQGLVNAIAAQINATTTGTVDAGATPTVAQIQTELAVLKAADTTTSNTYENFQALVNAASAGVSDQQASAASANQTLATAKSTLATDTTAATGAHTAYTTEAGTFSTANGNGTVSVSGNTLILTPTGGGTATVLANLDATTKAATVASGITETTNPDITNLLTKYNADVTAAAKVVTDTGAVSTAQSAADTANAAAKSMNPLTAQLAADNALVTTDTKAISTLAKDVAALQTANANATTLAGYQASVKGYTDALTAKGYVVTNLDATHVFNSAGAASDIYVVGKTDASVTAFGLQGSDALSVGSGYTLVQGKIGATGVTGNDAAMEIFVSNDTNGNAILQIEQHAYSSSVTGTGTGEIVTITLTGVDATTLHLNNGIITAGTPTA